MQRLLLSCLVLAASLSFATATVAGEADGRQLFDSHCATCHQSDGSGTPGLAPAIAERIGNRLNAATGRTFISHLLLSGMSGAIQVDGQRFVGFMPPLASLSDEHLASIANHLLRGLNAASLPGDFADFGPAEFAAARQHQMNPGEVHRLRQQSVQPPAERK